MSRTSDFDGLSSKYGAFLTPRVQIKIGGKNFDKEGIVVPHVEIDLTSGFKANVACFPVFGLINEDERKFTETATDLCPLGAPVDISVGYGSELERVFFGFVYSVTCKLPKSGDGFGSVVVRCMDVKGIMMNNQHYAQREDRSVGDLVRGILEKSPYNRYYDSLIVGRTPQGEVPITLTDESDYGFVVRSAKKLNYEFFVSQDTVYFRTAESQNSSMLTLRSGFGLEAVNVEFSTWGAASSIEVRNTSIDTGEPIIGTATSDACRSSGSSAAQALKGAHKVFVDSTAGTPSEAESMARALLATHERRFCVATFVCVGLPELVPGRFVTVKGVSSDIDARYYVVDVAHVIATHKFVTTLTARRCSL
jgi:phage protein D